MWQKRTLKVEKRNHFALLGMFADGSYWSKILADGSHNPNISATHLADIFPTFPKSLGPYWIAVPVQMQWSIPNSFFHLIPNFISQNLHGIASDTISTNPSSRVILPSQANCEIAPWRPNMSWCHDHHGKFTDVLVILVLENDLQNTKKNLRQKPTAKR